MSDSVETYRECVHIGKDDIDKADMEVAKASIRHLLDLQEEFVENAGKLSKTYRGEFALLGVSVICAVGMENPTENREEEPYIVQAGLIGTAENIAHTMTNCAMQLKTNLKEG